jgi:hypothetical protein
MSGPAARRLVLIVLLVAGAWLLAGARQARAGGPAAPRWPQDDRVYAVDGWTADPQEVEEAWGVTHVRRELRSDAGTTATVVISTNTTGKGIFGNAEVPFLGTGYAIAAPPVGLLPPGALGGRGTAVLARGPDGVWLLHYIYGQRGGPVPDVFRGLAGVLFDAVLGRTNDYYLVRVMSRAGDPDAPVSPDTAAETARLAEVLFGRIAAWYET